VQSLNWRYIHSMTSIQVKNVPSDVHQTLRRRAVGSGQSLQEYLLHLLCEQARTSTLDEVLERAGGRAGGNFSAAEAVAAVRAERDSR
jgi:plasmid stability protein